MNDTARLLQDQNFVRTLMDSLPCGFMVLDEEGRVQLMNTIMQQTFGISEQPVRGKRYGDILKCIHSLESSVTCGFTAYCPGCETRKLAFSALTENRKLTAQTSVQLLINGQLKNHLLLLSAVRSLLRIVVRSC